MQNEADAALDKVINFKNIFYFHELGNKLTVT